MRYISVPIETLRPGDYVLARDDNSPEEELVLRQVEERFERTAYVLLHLTLQDDSGRRQTLQTTAEHPVYRLGEGWVTAGELAAGDRIGQADGGVSVVVTARRESHRHGICVYNLRVAECHTYFVRAEGSDAEPVWVHNECGGRRGNENTRKHLEQVRDEFLANNPEYRHVGGGRNAITGAEIAEEYIPNPAGGRRGGAYADLTFENTITGERVRINTVDTLANGAMTPREAANFIRIYQNTNEPIVVFPKPR